MRAAVVLCLFLCSASAHAQDRRLVRALSERALTDDDFARRDFYTWTTSAQARRIRDERRLLSAGAGDGAVRAPYQRALDRIVHGDDARIARSLSARPRRYAWTTPYGTVVPRGDRSYGPILIHARMRRDVWTARFDPIARPAFRVVDAGGRPVPMAEVLADPQRIGVVLHVSEHAPRGAFREIVLHDERQIARVAIGTPEVDERVEDDVRTLRRLAAYARRHDVRAPRQLMPFWRRAERDPMALFAASMPFDTPRHRDLGAIVRALRTTPIRTSPFAFTPGT